MNSTPRTTEEQLAQLVEENEELKAELSKTRLELESARAEAEKNRSAAELAGEELQQFVYAASHDLQEPLRSIKIYSELLSRRHADLINAEAKEFLTFLQDGATRMEQLVRDLLAYTRASAVEDREQSDERVDADDALKAALANLSGAIEETGATVTAETSMSLLVLSGAEFAELLRAEPQVAVKMLPAIGARIRTQSVGGSQPLGS